ncbi:hypothetical protein AAE478_007120 [Parahypoxylon ruwenzoriense]
MLFRYLTPQIRDHLIRILHEFPPVSGEPPTAFAYEVVVDKPAKGGPDVSGKRSGGNAVTPAPAGNLRHAYGAGEDPDNLPTQPSFPQAISPIRTHNVNNVERLYQHRNSVSSIGLDTVKSALDYSSVILIQLYLKGKLEKGFAVPKQGINAGMHKRHILPAKSINTRPVPDLDLLKQISLPGCQGGEERVKVIRVTKAENFLAVKGRLGDDIKLNLSARLLESGGSKGSLPPARGTVTLSF